METNANLKQFSVEDKEKFTCSLDAEWSQDI